MPTVSNSVFLPDLSVAELLFFKKTGHRSLYVFGRLKLRGLMPGLFQEKGQAQKGCHHTTLRERIRDELDFHGHGIVVIRWG